jgi:DNA-binding SARP family transcriptional activator
MVEATEGAAGAAEGASGRTVLHLFTGPTVTVDGRQRAVPEGSKRLLGYVALHRRRIDRRQVAGALWPDGGDDRAGGNLRSALWRLRCAEINVLDADKWTLGLHEGVAVDIRDVHAWAERLINGVPGVEDLAVRPSWIDALDLLPGWCEDWVLYERERLRQRTLHALESLSRRLAEADRAADAVDAALLAVAAEPLRESAQRALIEAHIAEGNRAEALRTYETYRRLLRRELDVEPSPALLAPLRIGVREHSWTPYPMARA